MSDKPIPINTIQAAYLQFVGADVEYENEGTDAAVAIVTVNTGAGQKGLSRVSLTAGQVNTLTDAEAKKGIIQFISGGADTTAVLPAVDDDETEAYSRIIKNDSEDSVTIRSGENEYIIGQGLNAFLFFTSGAIEDASTGRAP